VEPAGVGAGEVIMGGRVALPLSRSACVRTGGRLILPVLLIGLALPLRAQSQAAGAVDPGVRGGSVDAGRPLPGLTPGQAATFASGLSNFVTVRSVGGNLPDTEDGLGPRYNSNSCGSCHSQPAIGGTSPSASRFPFVGANPQIAVATQAGAVNRIPYFIQADGPVREARFRRVVRNGVVTGTPDGGVHDLFTITGRVDATNTAGGGGNLQTCRLAQPDFEQMRHANNLSFRIPTPVFGAGLIESITDATILANLAANAADKQAFRISGRPNRNGNDGTITRFGWKAQNASALLFSGEAYSVEMGVSNELFAVERGDPGETLPAECLFNATPEDVTHLDPGPDTHSPYSDIQLFTIFMEFLAPPTPSVASPGGAASIQRGAALFRDTVRCALCHTPTLTASASSFVSAAAGTTAVSLYSDLLLHDMGEELADGVSQGLAGPREFRTAPLWGLGQRIFFLHDGRTTDLVQAIRMHGDAESEARASVEQYQRLSEQDKQHLLNFLRSL
jgi:CxxC motif-containing protein (DUF1111 family)